MYVCSVCGCYTEELHGDENDQRDLCESCKSDIDENRNNSIMNFCESMEKDVKYLKKFGENITPLRILNEQESIKFMHLKKYLLFLSNCEHSLCAGYSFKHKEFLIKGLDLAVMNSRLLVDWGCLENHS